MKTPFLAKFTHSVFYGLFTVNALMFIPGLLDIARKTYTEIVDDITGIVVDFSGKAISTSLTSTNQFSLPRN